MNYGVRLTERAEAESDHAFLRILSLLGLEFADACYRGLTIAISDLADSSGPYAHSQDEEASEIYGYAVRRLLYFGPTKKRSRSAYRVLFTVLEPAPDDEASTILILRVVHGARHLESSDE